MIATTSCHMSDHTEDYDKSYEGRHFYYSCHDGVLSTISRQEGIEGYPFGSVTPFCLDRQGRVVILVSDLAQHTKNILNDNKVSMTLAADAEKGSDVQAHARLTYIGQAKTIPQDELDQVKMRYVRYLPRAGQYFEAHSFTFYRIEMVKGRFIGGFGKIFWLEPDELLLDNPFDEAAEIDILNHMNEDHQQAMRQYLKNMYGIQTGKDNSLQMVGVDALGCDIRRDGRIHRIWFDKPVANSKEAREQLVQLAKS